MTKESVFHETVSCNVNRSMLLQCYFLGWGSSFILYYGCQIGDYLLTLPRQLEPFTSQDSVALRHALRLGKLPFSEGKEVGRGMVVEEEDGEGHPSDDWLGAVSRGTMETYCKYILLIPALSPAAASQLTTDIGVVW